MARTPTSTKAVTQVRHASPALRSAARSWSSTLIAENPGQVELLAKLGKHKMGKACLYFKRLADLDATVLEALIAGSVAEVKRRYPNTGDA